MKWTDVLPSLQGDSEVLVVLLPKTAKVVLREYGNVVVSLLVVGGQERGLQVLRPYITDWEQSREVLISLGLAPVIVRYRGSLSEIPQKLLLSESAPLVMYASAQYLSHLDLRAAMKNYVADWRPWVFNRADKEPVKYELRN